MAKRRNGKTANELTAQATRIFDRLRERNPDNWDEDPLYQRYARIIEDYTENVNNNREYSDAFSDRPDVKIPRSVYRGIADSGKLSGVGRNSSKSSTAARGNSNS